MSFIARHGLWTEEQQRHAADCLQEIAAKDTDSIRIGFPDLHGIVRGKVVMAESLADVFEDGLAITSSLLLKDTSHRAVAHVFTPGAEIGVSGSEGAADIVLVPDPGSIRRWV